MMLIDKLAWIEIRDKKILSTRSKGKDTYYIPGGKREAGESDHQALIREIQEELSVTLAPETLEYLATFQAQAHGHAPGVKVKMQCYKGSCIGDIVANNEIEEVVWLSYSDRNLVSPVDKLIFDWLKQQYLID
ncbi:NUDIX domain-containing protein [Pontibacter silvestris]|uniref:8-oxo-dGTP diphosphatase n=1 Tax=Pontibacter silvestris TaxID=2305183 RepID=A0ABW4X5F8_9BACT|nr:NUDIX domain-containing protein [Pontibacter silvestris]MCC9137961.1 NUDIX domain-containing protein [Pontibacter silvestris]